jgi:hypothetical protein
MGRHYDGAAGLPQKYKVSAKQPIDIREIVDTFDDLLDNKMTFYNSAYKGMRVLVLDESCVYEMVSDAFSKSSSDWKRLTIETITEWSALKRAMDNLVNGALIYLANDITELDASNNPTSTVHKVGIYFCENENGTGKLTLAGGGGAELENLTIDFGQYEDSVSVVIMDPSTITRARMRNVKNLLISYGETMQQEYTEGTTINLGNADFIVLDITRTEEGQNATVGLTLKKND